MRRRVARPSTGSKMYSGGSPVAGVEAAEVGALALAEVDVRLGQEVEHLVVEGDDEDRPERDGEGGSG